MSESTPRFSESLADELLFYREAEGKTLEKVKATIEEEERLAAELRRLAEEQARQRMLDEEALWEEVEVEEFVREADIADGLVSRSPSPKPSGSTNKSKSKGKTKTEASKTPALPSSKITGKPELTEAQKAEKKAAAAKKAFLQFYKTFLKRRWARYYTGLRRKLRRNAPLHSFRRRHKIIWKVMTYISDTEWVDLPGHPNELPTVAAIRLAGLDWPQGNKAAEFQALVDDFVNEYATRKPTSRFLEFLDRWENMFGGVALNLS